MEKIIIEVYGKEMKGENNAKFITCSTKVVKDNGEAKFCNVRFTNDCKYKAVKGMQKVAFTPDKANIKKVNGYDVMYIKECEAIEYTPEEIRAKEEASAERTANYFNRK